MGQQRDRMEQDLILRKLSPATDTLLVSTPERGCRRGHENLYSC